MSSERQDGRLRLRHYLFAIAGFWTLPLVLPGLWVASGGNISREAVGLVAVLLWLAGLVALYLGGRHVRQRIVERDEAEMRLRESEAELRRAQAVAHIGSYTWDLRSGRAHWSEELHRITANPEAKPGFEALLALLHPDDRERVVAQARQAHEEADGFDLEFRIVRPDGDTRWVRDRALIERDATGHVIRIHGTVQDITDWVGAETAVKESEARLQSVYESITAGLVLQDGEGSIVYANDAATEILVLSREELEGRTSDDPDWQMIDEGGRAVPGADHPAMITLRTGQPIRNAVRGLFTEDPAKTRWLLINTEPIFDGQSGTVKEVLSTFQDITDLRRAEEALRYSEERLGDVVSAMPVLLDAFDKDGNLVFWNAECERVTGYGAAEVLGDPAFMERLYPDPAYRAWVFAEVAAQEGSFRDLEFELTCRDGTKRLIAWTNVSAVTPIAGWDSWAVGVDVTERRQAERALKESEERLALALLGGDLGTWDWHIPSDKVVFNERWAGMLGYTLDEITPRVSSWQGLLHPDDAAPTQAALEAHLAGKTPHYETEHRLRHKSGSWVWILDKGRVIERDGEGNPLRACGTHLDITERKEAEERLALQALVLDQIQDQVTITDLEGTITYVNEAQTRAMGHPREVLLGQNVEIYGEDPERGARQREIVEATLRDGQWRGQVINYTASGEEIIVDTRTQTILDCEGNPIALCGVASDITARVRMEDALRESEERLRLLYLSMVEGMAQHEVIYGETGRPVNYRILSVNPAYERITGIPAAKAQGRLATEVYGTDAPPYLEEFTDVVTGGAPKTMELFFPPMDTHFFVSVISPQPGRFATVFLDITERKRIEMALRESEANLRAAQRLAGLGSFRYELREHTLTWSEELYRIYGRAPEKGAPLGEEHDAYVHPGDRYLTRDMIQQMRQCGGQGDFEYRITRDDGEARVLRAVTRWDRDDQGEPVIFLGAVQDVTEQRAAEAQLRLEKERAQSYLDVAASIIVALDAEGRVTLINEEGARILECSREEITGKSWFHTAIPEDVREGVEKVFHQLIAGEIEAAEYFENAIVTAQGREKRIRWHNSLIRDGQGHVAGTLSSGEDVTDRVQLEEQLRQAQKMEAVGQLAGGVAHDFNNLLQVIDGYTDMAIEEIEPHHPVAPYLDEVAQAGERAAKLVSQLLAFSRRQVIKPESLDMNEVIAGLMKMLRRVIGEHIRVAFIPGSPLGSVRADRGQMEQVILNLCVNARDAMPTGGELLIETQHVVFDEAYCAAHAWAHPGDFVTVSITDSGCGMDKDTLERIFEPFYTTKEVGKGTGLGLSTVYGIVRQHDGMVHVYSEPGHGATFKVYLPGADVNAEEPAPQAVDEVRGGTETILLAEDEEMVRTLAIRILERGGYTVLSATNGEEALALAEEHGEDIGLAVLDVVMPRLGGRAVYDRLKDRFSRMRFLFASGYSQNAVHTDFVLEAGFELIQKPFSPKDLLRRVRSVLDK